ncbi:MAG TPA: SCO family protein [Bordetella sp.]|nr:SCO family protein [Bordetella sp.]
MWRTAAATLILTALAYAGGAWLTMDFQVWTAEGARRSAVLRSPVAAPVVEMHGLGTHAQSLPEMLHTAGTATIVDFIYTRCITVCSVLGGTFQHLQSALRADRDAGRPTGRLMSISFDPANDTPEALAAYGQRFQADASLWRFVAPVREQDVQFLLQRYGVVVIPDGLGGYEHNAALLVIDGDGRLVKIYDYDQTSDALALARYLAAKA